MNIFERTTLALAAAAALSVTACKQQNINRLEGEWEYVDGDITLDAGSSLTWEFKEDGEFEQCYEYGSDRYCSDEYEWTWDGDLDTDLELEYDGYETDVEVKELSRDELKVEFDSYDLEFERVD